MIRFGNAGLILFLCFLILAGCKKDEPTGPQFNSLTEEIEYLVDEYVKMGAAIGIIHKDQNAQELYFGTLSGNNGNLPNGHSIFEIGSITKTFTATLLAQMILDGKISLEDKVEYYLPGDEVTMPAWGDITLTIEHLATHSASLPKAPRDSDQPLPPGFDPYDPYAAYTTPYVYDYLTNYCDLQCEPGTGLCYSNTGMGLLGHILGLIDQSSYEELVTREIFEPLGMHETSLFLTESQITRLAPGHDDCLDSVQNYFANDIFQGAGFIKSTLGDMLIYLKAHMGLIETPLAEAMAMTQNPYFNLGGVTYDDREGYYNLSIGLAWHIDLLPEGYTFHNHGGRTNGYMAYIGFDLTNLTGVVILCNHSCSGIILRFGEDLLKAVNKY